MRHVSLSIACAATIQLMLTASLWGHPPENEPTAEQIQAAYAAHKDEFNFLLGSWKLTATYTQSGKKVQGYWDAVRLEDGGYILDEIRAVNDAGVTTFSAVSLRSYNTRLARWDIVTSNKGTGLEEYGTGSFNDNEMLMEQNFGVSGPNPFVLRIRFYAIRQDRFSYAADRSDDGGKTWTKDFLDIEAQRIGPPRTVDVLGLSKGTPKRAPDTQSRHTVSVSHPADDQPWSDCRFGMLDLDRHAIVAYTGGNLAETHGVLDLDRRYVPFTEPCG